MCSEGGVAAAAAAVTFGEFLRRIEGVVKRRSKRCVWKDREKNCKALDRGGARSMPASLLVVSLSTQSHIFHTLPHTRLYLLFLSASFMILSSIFASVSLLCLVLSCRQLDVHCTAPVVCAMQAYAYSCCDSTFSASVVRVTNAL